MLFIYKPSFQLVNVYIKIFVLFSTQICFVCPCLVSPIAPALAKEVFCCGLKRIDWCWYSFFLCYCFPHVSMCVGWCWQKTRSSVEPAKCVDVQRLAVVPLQTKHLCTLCQSRLCFVPTKKCRRYTQQLRKFRPLKTREHARVAVARRILPQNVSVVHIVRADAKQGMEVSEDIRHCRRPGEKIVSRYAVYAALCPI